MDKTGLGESKRILDEAFDWVSALEAPNVSAKTREDFENWLNEDLVHFQMYEKARSYRAAFSTLAPSDIRRPLRYSPLKFYKLRFSEIAESLLPQRGWAIGTAGAVAAAMVLFFLLNPNTPDFKPLSAPIIATYESDIGEVKSLLLADGSEVTLGPRAAIETQFSEDKRIVRLTTGAAFFEVASDKDRPFTVQAGDLTATVLGTKFDVRSNAGTYRVGVAEGKVEVGYPLTISGNTLGMVTAQQLTAGQQIAATQTSGLERIVPIDPQDVAPWRSNRLIYNRVSIAELAADLNRYSSTPIVLEGPPEAFEEFRFRGIFQKPDIDEILTVLSKIHPIDVDWATKEQIVLRPRKAT